MSVSNPPTGCETVTPYLTLKDVNGFLDFVKKVFNAEVTENIFDLDGKSTFHAQIKIGTSRLMVGDHRGSEVMPAMLYIYVNDSDAVFRRAVAAGARSIMEPMDMFYGDRHGGVEDAWGNTWWIATHQEDVSSEELQKRSDAEMRRRQAS